jgi:2-oxoglutarate ferredoxin oxidoreductase subunit beta
VSSLAAASGAVYVARWTVLHVRRLETAMMEALNKRGFSMVEVISPCPTGFGRRQKERLGLDTMRYYHEHGVITHDGNVHEAAIELRGKIIEGKFVDVDKPTFMEFRDAGLQQALGVARPRSQETKSK